MAYIQPDNVPLELRERPQWVNWTYETDDKGKETKQPRSPFNGSICNVQEPWNQSDFKTALDNATRNNCGIGFVLTAADPYVCIDLDSPIGKRGIEPADVERIYQNGSNIVADANSYTEWSPSGKGLHVWVKASVPLNGVRSSLDCIELYSTARFMTVTGVPHGDPKPIAQRDELAKVLHRALDRSSTPIDEIVSEPCELTTGQIYEKLCRYENGPKFLTLLNTPFGVGDDNAIDQGLMNFIVHATQNVEKARECFNLTPRANRDKWRNRLDYQDRTIRRAFDDANNVPLVPLPERLTIALAEVSGLKSVGTPSNLNGSHISQTYLVRSGGELESLPAMQWRIKGLLPAKGLAAIYAEPGAGKSFIALDAAATIADPNEPEWFDYKVKHAPVLYIALEGQAGYRNRVRAWEFHNGRKSPAKLGFMLDNPFDITNSPDVDRLINTIPRGCVVVIDTLNQSAPMVDENTSQGMGSILSSANRIVREKDALIVFVHHSTKSKLDQSLRGHGSLHGAMDAEIFVSVDADGNRRWKVVKSKDGEVGREYGFKLRRIPLGLDSDGDEVASCCVERIELSTLADKEPKPKDGVSQWSTMSQNQKLAMDAYYAAGRKNTNPTAPVPISAWINEFKTIYQGKPDSAIRIMRELPERLCEKGFIVDVTGNGDYVFPHQYESSKSASHNANGSLIMQPPNST